MPPACALAYPGDPLGKKLAKSRTVEAAATVQGAKKVGVFDGCVGLQVSRSRNKRGKEWEVCRAGDADKWTLKAVGIPEIGSRTNHTALN